ncbi:hypothetical protein CFD26_100675 [Aspergillus turcosus]|uniref:SNF2 N-terminal domain-containing protein n=1 Tax=Aspergillus turcosus TaxID=1245748 RepID=A0A3R7JBW7_9EURO|nr:hypothetical protein CFD26_100675 [Aspergillus turcosus]
MHLGSAIADSRLKRFGQGEVATGSEISNSTPKLNDLEISGGPVQGRTTFSEYQRVRLLQPKKFTSLFIGGYITLRDAYWALPVIMRMVCLRRDMGDPADAADANGACIGDEIPAMRIMSVDIKHPARVHRDHNIRFAQLMELRARVGDAFTILLFQGSALHTSDYLRKSLTVDTLSDLETQLQALDPMDVMITRTIVLSSYTTWAMRTMHEAAQNLDDETAEQEDFGSGRKAQQAKRYNTYLSGWFGRKVCDEGHAAKSIRTRAHEAIAQLEAAHIWFLTAIPLYNRAFDMCGYLAILYSGLRGAGTDAPI